MEMDVNNGFNLGGGGMVNDGRRMVERRHMVREGEVNSSEELLKEFRMFVEWEGR